MSHRILTKYDDSYLETLKNHLYTLRNFKNRKKRSVTMGYGTVTPTV